MKQAALVLAAALALPAHAGIVLSNFPPNPGLLPGGGWQFTPNTTFGDPPPPRAWVNGVMRSVPAAVVTDSLALKGPAGNLPVAVTTTVGAPAIASALARVASRASVPLAVGMTAYDLLKSSGIRQGASAPEMDIGTDQVDNVETEYSCHMGSQYASKSNSLSGCAEQIVSKAQANADSKLNPAPLWSGNQTQTVYTYSLNSCGSSSCWIKSTQQTQERFCSSGVCAPWKNTGPLTTINSNLVEASSKSVTSKSCPKITDALTGESYVPGQYSDGKCMTGRYSPVTQDQAAARLSPYVSSDPVASAKAVLQAGETIDADPYQVTGPASQTGQPTSTTTTTPTGTTTVTTTPTYNYTYQGDTITISTTNTTTTNITNNQGDTTTTTETTTNAGSDDKGMCTMYPDSLACMKPGAPPTDPAPTPKTFPISIEPMAFPGQGACPVPIGFSVFGAAYAFEWTPFCDALTAWVRPIVLVLSIAAAAMIFVGGLKS